MWIFNLTRKLKSQAKDLGVELVGVCSLRDSNDSLLRFKNGPQYSSAIVIGCKHSDGAFQSGNLRAIQYDTNCIIQELDHIAFNLIRALEKEGYKSIAFSSYVPVEMSNETKGFFGDVSHRYLAAKAGLGCIGHSRLLITPNYGPRIRFASILTTAPLEFDRKFNDFLCEDCGKECAKACPVNAITDEGVDVRKCSRENMKYGLPGLIELLSELVSSEDLSTGLKTFFKDPRFWRLWQATTSGMFYDCFECMKACPIGL